MMSLQEHQQLFLSALRNDLDINTLDIFNQTDTFKMKERLQVYRGSITMSHINALKLIYPVICELLGEATFMAYAKDYYWLYPTTKTDMNFFGIHWPEYMKKCADEREELADYPFLSDLSLLEQFLHNSFYASDDELFNFKKFQSNSEHDFIFYTSHSLSVMVSNHPIKTIYDMHKQNSIHKIENLNIREYLCIYRKEWSPEVSCISESMFLFLTEVQAGVTLETLSEKPELQLEINLVEAISKGWVTCFSMNNE